MNNDENNQPLPVPPPAPLTEEQIKRQEKQVQRSDFDLGAGTKHLRLPNGLPKRK
jgi:hypothetical protein